MNVSSLVQQQAFYLGEGSDAIFAWHHTCQSLKHTLNATAIICAPWGHEYMHSHRTLRKLADMLAIQGMNCIRFDAYGCGNSAGDERAVDLWTRWNKDLAQVIQYAKQQTPRVILIGLRLGATLAMKACEPNSSLPGCCL